MTHSRVSLLLNYYFVVCTLGIVNVWKTMPNEAGLVQNSQGGACILTVSNNLLFYAFVWYIDIG